MYRQIFWLYLTNDCNTFQVILQTTAVATATMPIAGGFVGIIPALMMMDEKDANGSEVFRGSPWSNFWALTLWALSISFFGVFFAVPLRKQTILREKLKFPSGTATAEMIRVLHWHPPILVGGEEVLSGGGWAKLPPTSATLHEDEDQEGGLGIEMKSIQPEEEERLRVSEGEEDGGGGEEKGEGEGNGEEAMVDVDIKEADEDGRLEDEIDGEGGVSGRESEKEDMEWRTQWSVLGWTFVVSSVYAVAAFFFPILHDVPVFTWLGLPGLTDWKWTLMPSFAYIGQGMIMGTR